MAATSTNPLVVCRIIGDVVDMVVPSIIMTAYYGSKHVTNGCNIKPSIAFEPPSISITGNSHDLYTLVMTDPDAPSPSEPSMRELVHWIVANIPGGSNPTQGNEILPYMPPHPRMGIHRYIFVLFKQKGRIGVRQQPMSRINFSTRAFAHQLDLGLPVATVYFNAQKEIIKRKH
ncbi:hypothetical protein NMG60_11003491 [Bertholletia excelsa]